MILDITSSFPGDESIEIFLCNQRHHSQISPTFWRIALKLLSGKVRVEVTQ